MTAPPLDGSHDIRALMGHLPHRYPFLLVDRILECREQKTVVALTNVTYNDLRYSAGIGVTWLTPLGAIRLSWAKPLNPRPQDILSYFQFTLASYY